MWAVRSFVLARKGVLVSSPDVKNMTRTQWALEYIALKKKEKDKFELHCAALKKILIGVLGLNMLRPEDANGNPKMNEELTDKEKEEFLPLVAWTGREEMLKKLTKQYQYMEDFDKSTSDAAYEELAQRIDEAGGDMEPILGLETNIDTPKEVKREHELAGMKVDILEVDRV